MLRPTDRAHSNFDERVTHYDHPTPRPDFNDRFPHNSHFASRSYVAPADSSPVGGSYIPSPSSNIPTLSHHDRFNDPTASMLDLGDDTSRFSSANLADYDDERLSSYDDSDGPSIARMSLLGPKMRFHSRAPWELEESALQEEEDAEDTTRGFFGSSVFIRAKDNTPKSSASGSSNSPRVSGASRPSGESNRSQIFPKRSFETPSSKISYPRGALYALAQESLSATSLSRIEQEDSSRGLNPAPLPPPTVSVPFTPSHAQSSFNYHFPSDSHTPHQASKAIDPPRQSFDSRYRSSISSDEDIHPYANPDLVISYAVAPPPHSPLRSTIPYSGINRSDSIATVTESVGSNSISKGESQPSLISDNVTPLSTSKRRISSVQGKEISSPLSNTALPDGTSHAGARRGSTLPPGVNDLPGWTDHGKPLAFGLISLEEARAQRSRSSTLHTPVSRAPDTTSSPLLFSDISSNTHTSSAGQVPRKARARSISAGKAKSALQSIGGLSKLERMESYLAQDVQASSTSGSSSKSLKHKKSGLMRLLGRGQEKEEGQPPPVPPLSDNYSAYNSQPLPKLSSHRIPVPSSATRIQDDKHSPSATSLSSLSSSKRTPPPLSINTQPHASTSRTSESQFSLQSRQTLPTSVLERPWLGSEFPQSAPPNMSEFPTLKLRPVSTLFSAQFGDHVIASDLQPTLESDLDTPRSQSPNGIMSPVTPGSYLRLSNEQPSVSVNTGEQSSIIKALQEEFTSAKKIWLMQKLELEGQIKDLKAELDELRVNKDEKLYCDSCGRDARSSSNAAAINRHVVKQGGMVNRPRARTGTGTAPRLKDTMT